VLVGMIDTVWDAKFSPIFKNRNGKAVVVVDKIGNYEKINLIYKSAFA